MTTDNRRKEEKSKAQAENSKESFVPFPNSAQVVEAVREQSFLPGSRENKYIAKIENVLSDWNVQAALNAVKRNKGAPGIDGITTVEIEESMRKQWQSIKQQILEGKYIPKPVKRVEIPKPDGKGVRQLGIPTVMDRIIQQALHQELVFVFEPNFSAHSYGFRRYRNAHQAILQAQKYIQEGCEWVVDIDLEKFFDRVNHDMLMARIARKVGDKKVLLLIRRYLQSGGEF
jgi:RNA-directed DNA polymerase